MIELAQSVNDRAGTRLVLGTDGRVEVIEERSGRLSLIASRSGAVAGPTSAGNRRPD